MIKKIVIFTDLDGTLLDHHTYSPQPAAPALVRLEKANILVIPTTSKTLAEVEALNLPIPNGPAIGENGMVMAIKPNIFAPPHDQSNQIALGHPYTKIIECIQHQPPKIKQSITGFNDMSIKDVMQNTGLDHASATLAKARLGSEPFLWSGSPQDFDTFKNNVEQADLSITQGGRFYHLTSKGGKANAMDWVIARLQDTWQTKDITSIALGDGPNDAGMLARATYGIRIPNADGNVNFDIQNPQGTIITANAPGPEGWASSINTLLDDWGFAR